MTRVVTFAHHQMLLAEFTRTQREMSTVQEQIASGKVTDQFKGIASETGVLLATKRAEAKADGYLSAGRELDTRLDLQNLHLETLAGLGDDLRQAVTEALAQGSSTIFMERLEGIFNQAVAVLNTRVDGRYLYGGTRTDVPPVNVASVADLLAAPSVASVFDNNNVKSALRIDESQTLEYGLLASDLATDFFTTIRAIATFDASGSGPLDGTLDETQRSFLEGQLQTLIGVTENMNLETAKNGVKMNELTNALERHEKSQVVMKTLISEIEDVDMAEAVTRLNQTQLSAQASARVLAQLNQLSLLNFLPLS